MTDLRSAPLPPLTDADHVRGPAGAPLLTVYADYECPFCAVTEARLAAAAVRVCFRHFPVRTSHPRAWAAAQAAEAAAAQGAFWKMHDLLLDHQDALQPRDLVRYAGELGLDVERFRADLRGHTGAAHIAEDVDSAELSGVSGTATFFVNGRRHYGAYDIATLSAAVKTARKRAAVGS